IFSRDWSSDVCSSDLTTLSTNELVFIFADLPHRDRLYQSLYFNRLGKLLKGLLIEICTRLKRIHRDLTNLDKVNTAGGRRSIFFCYSIYFTRVLGQLYIITLQ